MSMTDCGFTYPTISDFEAALPNVLPALKSGACPDEIDCPCFVHCYWVVVGYVKSVAYPLAPDETAKKKMLAARKCKTKEDVVEALESLGKRGAAAGASFDWASLLQMLLQILTQLFPPKPPVPAP